MTPHGPFRDRLAARRRADEGVGIIEIIVAITIFGLVMAAAVPVMYASAVQTARASQLATASQLANQQLERARSAGTSCSQLKTHLAGSSANAMNQTNDSRGIDFVIEETDPETITCPATNGLVSYTVTVTADTNVSTRAVTATLSTEIWVGKD